MIARMGKQSDAGEPGRRKVLAGLAASFAGALAAGAARGQGGASATCVLTPETGEGPFYFDPRLVRADITEQRPGVPLTLDLRVLTAGTCAAIAGARVDLWHADSRGLYSGYARQPGTGVASESSATGETFLRGTQFADRDGLTSFRTVYPSWYRGRTPHIHFKVILAAGEVVSSQLYFPDSVSEQVFTRSPPYADRARNRDTFNRNDRFLRGRTGGAFCDVTPHGDGYRAAVTIAVAPG